jgi:signal transduction histidine kinase
VASIGGKIELESAPGEGALFRVCLPVRSTVASPPQPTSIPPQG